MNMLSLRLLRSATNYRQISRSITTENYNALLNICEKPIHKLLCNSYTDKFDTLSRDTKLVLHCPLLPVNPNINTNELVNMLDHEVTEIKAEKEFITQNINLNNSVIKKHHNYLLAYKSLAQITVTGVLMGCGMWLDPSSVFIWKNTFITSTVGFPITNVCIDIMTYNKIIKRLEYFKDACIIDLYDQKLGHIKLIRDKYVN